MHRVTKLKLSVEHHNEFAVLQGLPQSPDLYPIEPFWVVAEQEILISSSAPKICRNCAVVSCQYGAKFLRIVSNTLMKVCHEEFRQFLRLNWIQPFISTQYLIKWPLSEYVGYKIPTAPSQLLLRFKCKLKEFSPVLSGGIL